MQIEAEMVKLDEPTTEIHIWIKTKKATRKATICKAKQDRLGRVYITVR